jgi:hypothetical protein
MKIKKFDDFINESRTEDGLNEGLYFPLWQPFAFDLYAIWKKWRQKSHPSKPIPPKAPSYLTGKHMLYIPHQQGPAGAAAIFKAAKGVGDLTDSMRKKMRVNVPTGSTYEKIIADNQKSDKEAAIAFLKYYSENWAEIEKKALSEISKPQHSKVKKAIDGIKNPKLPKEFLYTVAFKESTLGTMQRSGSQYKGLFQIGPLAWQELKNKLPKAYQGSVIPVDFPKNAQAGHDYLDLTYKAFKKKVE